MNSEDFSFLFKPLEWPLVFFLVIFSLGIAVFYSVFASALYKINYRPKWLFFALLPAIIIGAAIISRSYVLATFVGIFLFLVVLAIVGMIYAGIKGIMTDLKRSKNKRPLWKNILITIAIILFTIVFFASGPYAIILIFAYSFLSGILFPDSEDNFLRLQTTLPTSKIRSLAMGLVEVQGKAKMIDPLISRIGKKECIGYAYRTEAISKDKDGKNSYSTINYEVVCNPFMLEDETGAIKIKPDDIDFVKFEKDASYSSGKKRYTQYILQNDLEVLLIGKANRVKGEVIIQKETIKKVFALSPAGAINTWNKFYPLRKSFITYMAGVAVIVAVILLLTIRYEDNTIICSFDTRSFLSFKDIFK